MGAHTNYLGHVDIVPNLNQAEYDYLRAFAASRRSQRREGPYAVPAPMSYGGRKRRGDDDNQVAAGQPSFWCHWVPCPQGCCLGWNGWGEVTAGAEWLRYLVNHFLRPGALAERSADRQFAEFSFDHAVDGFVVGEQRDIRELFGLAVSGGKVEQVVLHQGDPRRGEEGHLRGEGLPWLARDEWELPYPWPDEPSYPEPVPRSTRTRPAPEKASDIRVVPE